MKRQFIPKIGGGEREFGIPTVLDFVSPAMLAATPFHTGLETSARFGYELFSNALRDAAEMRSPHMRSENGQGRHENRQGQENSRLVRQ